MGRCATISLVAFFLLSSSHYSRAESPLNYDFSADNRVTQEVKTKYDGNVWVLSGAQKFPDANPDVASVFVFLTLEACNKNLYEILNYTGDNTERSLGFSERHQSIEVVVSRSGYRASYVCSKQPIRLR